VERPGPEKKEEIISQGDEEGPATEITEMKRKEKKLFLKGGETGKGSPSRGQKGGGKNVSWGEEGVWEGTWKKNFRKPEIRGQGARQRGKGGLLGRCVERVLRKNEKNTS